MTFDDSLDWLVESSWYTSYTYFIDLLNTYMGITSTNE